MGKSLVCCFLTHNVKSIDVGIYGPTAAARLAGRALSACMTSSRLQQIDADNLKWLTHVAMIDRSSTPAWTRWDEVSAAAAVAEAAAGWAVCAQSSDKTSTRRQSVTHSATVAPSRLPSVI